MFLLSYFNFFLFSIWFSYFYLHVWLNIQWFPSLFLTFLNLLFSHLSLHSNLSHISSSNKCLTLIYNFWAFKMNFYLFPDILFFNEFPPLTIFHDCNGFVILLALLTFFYAIFDNCLFLNCFFILLEPFLFYTFIYMFHFIFNGSFYFLTFLNYLFSCASLTSYISTILPWNKCLTFFHNFLFSKCIPTFLSIFCFLMSFHLYLFSMISMILCFY